MSDYNIGIVGLGWVAGAHIETFKHVTGAKVTAVCSRRQLDEKQLEQQYGQPLKVYSDYAAMLADLDIHVIDICTEHPLRLRHKEVLHPMRRNAARSINEKENR